MKMAISATGSTLGAAVDRRFGRCAWFILVDPETMEYEALENRGADAGTGAGTGAAQLVLEREVDAVISGQVGPNAYEVLKQGGVQIFIAPEESSVREALDKFTSGELKQMTMKVF